MNLSHNEYVLLLILKNIIVDSRKIICGKDSDKLYCSLPRKTQKTDKQNTKNPPEKKLPGGFKTYLNGFIMPFSKRKSAKRLEKNAESSTYSEPFYIFVRCAQNGGQITLTSKRKPQPFQTAFRSRRS